MEPTLWCQHCRCRARSTAVSCRSAGARCFSYTRIAVPTAVTAIALQLEPLLALAIHPFNLVSFWHYLESIDKAQGSGSGYSAAFYKCTAVSDSMFDMHAMALSGWCSSTSREACLLVIDSFMPRR